MDVRQRIIKKVQELEDPDMLHLLEEWLNAVLDVEEKFSPEEMDSVMEGYTEYKSGNLIGHEEVQKRFDKWLKEE